MTPKFSTNNQTLINSILVHFSFKFSISHSVNASIRIVSKYYRMSRDDLVGGLLRGVEPTKRINTIIEIHLKEKFII